MCCNVLQCAVVSCCSGLQWVAVCCGVLQYVAVRVAEYVAARVAECIAIHLHFCRQCAAVAVCCSMLQCVSQSMLQRVLQSVSPTFWASGTPDVSKEIPISKKSPRNETYTCEKRSPYLKGALQNRPIYIRKGDVCNRCTNSLFYIRRRCL